MQENGSDSGLSPDEVAETCLLAGLMTVSDKEMPIMTSEFYTRHMLPAKPPGMLPTKFQGIINQENTQM